jgi:hypothetical protein
VTQEGWAAWLERGRRTIQRWEMGTVAPDVGAQQALVALCAAKGLFRPYDHGPLRGLAISPAWLSDLLAAARHAADVLEREAFRRAVEGWDEQHVSAKGEVYSVTKYDSQLLQFLLRARRPEKFRETQRHEIGGVGEAAIHFVLSPGEQHGKAQPREIEE